MDGYVIGSCIKHVPLAGKDITKYIKDALIERGEQVATEDIMNVAKEIKDKYSYVSEDPIAEFDIFDTRVKEKGKMVKLKTTSIVTGKVGLWLHTLGNSSRMWTRNLHGT